MTIYEYKTNVRYNDITEENELSDRGLLNILSEAAGRHSEEARIWIKHSKKHRIYMDAIILESKIF